MKNKFRSGHNIFEDCLPSFLGELSSCRLTDESCNESSAFFKVTGFGTVGLPKTGGQLNIYQQGKPSLYSFVFGSHHRQRNPF